MKLPDTEQLQPDEYLLITDPWRQDWESGVQVPVNPEETLNKQINLWCVLYQCLKANFHIVPTSSISLYNISLLCLVDFCNTTSGC